MPVINTLVGDSLWVVQSYSADAASLRNLPWLELKPASGRLFEIVPTAVTVSGIEILGLSIREVATFRSIQKWPGGPVKSPVSLDEFAPILNKPIAAASVESTSADGMDDCLKLGIWGYGRVLIEHDHSLPESLVVQLSKRRLG